MPVGGPLRGGMGGVKIYSNGSVVCCSLFFVCSIEHKNIFVLGFLFDISPISLVSFTPARHFPGLVPWVHWYRVCVSTKASRFYFDTLLLMVVILISVDIHILSKYIA